MRKWRARGVEDESEMGRGLFRKMNNGVNFLPSYHVDNG